MKIIIFVFILVFLFLLLPILVAYIYICIFKRKWLNPLPYYGLINWSSEMWRRGVKLIKKIIFKKNKYPLLRRNIYILRKNPSYLYILLPYGILCKFSGAMVVMGLLNLFSVIYIYIILKNNRGFTTIAGLKWLFIFKDPNSINTWLKVVLLSIVFLFILKVLLFVLASISELVRCDLMVRRRDLFRNPHFKTKIINQSHIILFTSSLSIIVLVLSVFF